MVRARYRLVTSIAALLVAALAGACGGDGGDGGEAIPTTAAAPVSTTTTVAPDPEAERLAAAGIVTVEDLGPPWKVHTEAKGADPPSLEGCAAKNGAPTATIPPGAAHTGAALQRGEASRFVTTFTRVFPDETRAQAYTAVFTTDGYLACERERRTKAEVERTKDPNLSFSGEVLPLPENRPEGMEALVRFQFQVNENGVVTDANGTAHTVIARKGRAVVLMELEELSTEKDSDDTARLVSEESAVALEKALRRLG